MLGSHQGPGAPTLSRGRCGAAIGPSQRRLVGRSPGGPLPRSLGPAKRLGPGGPPPLAPGQGLAVAGAGAVQWEVGNVAAAAGAELRGWILEQQTESLGGLGGLGGLAEEEILLVGGLEHFLFFHILGIIIPTD